MQGLKIGYIICLALTIMLVGLHFAVAGTGHVWYSDRPDAPNNVNYQNKNFDQYAAFIIIASILTFIISIILLAGLCSICLSPRLKHILATLNLILEFAIAVVVSLLASTSSNEKNMYKELNGLEFNDLNSYYRLAVADAIITFVLQVVYLAIIYLGTLREISQNIALEPINGVLPPITADRLN